MGYVHAKTEDGSLAISNTSTRIPLLQKARFEKHLSNKEVIYRDMMNMKSFRTTAQSINLPCDVGKETITSVTEEHQAWAKLVRTSDDGQELATEEVDKANHLCLK